MVEEDPADAEVRDAERMKFFTDAVVAIAMTLLILPLIESVADVRTRSLTTATFLHENAGQLATFVISFFVIAQFWVNHERMFDRVERCTPRLRRLNLMWMLTIVFLPIPTAMSGEMETDRLQLALYIGTMLASSVLMGLMSIVVRRDHRITGGHRPPTVAVLADSIATPALFAVALVLALALPHVHYYPLLILFMTGPASTLLGRVLRPATNQD